MTNRRRPALLLAAALVSAFLLGTVTVPAYAGNDDECRAVAIDKSRTITHDEIVAYLACREDRQDAVLARLAAGLGSPSPEPSPTLTVTPTASPTPSPTASPTPSATPSATASPTATPTTTPSSGTTVLDLPKAPYAGGPDYWAQFPAAKAAGWADPAFFPIVAWYGSCSPEQYTFDKARGINTYAQCNPDTEWAGLQAAGMDTLFTAKNQPANATTQPGVLLDDEVDGRYSDADGRKHLADLDAIYGTGGKFSYVNYTSGIVTFDRSIANSSAYLNGSFNDVIGLDQYFYSNPQCDWTNPDQAFRYRTPEGQTPIGRDNCRSSSSYGKAQQLLQEVDGSDGKTTKAIWAFVEVVAPGGGNQNGGSYVQPTGAQISAAAWHSIIEGAAGIDWFTNSPDGGSANPCLSGDVLADARLGRGCSAVKPNVEAMGQVNRQILSLAPVLNTPTYVWNFGAGTDTMLKAKDGSAYVFAMTKDKGAGSRTFTLPTGVTGTTVEVVGENRALPVAAGKFSDTFASETATHVYKIAL